MFSLEGRTAMITGATRGIGAEMAIALAEAGSDIILIQVNHCIGKLMDMRFAKSQIEGYDKYCY